MKSGIRIAAITTGPIGKPHRRGDVLLVCVVGGKNTVEGILSTKVQIDGTDSTGKIISMINASRFRDQIRLVALNGIALAGLNMVDAEKVCESLHVDTLVITRNKPRVSLLMKSLRSLKGGKSGITSRVKLLKSQRISERMDGFYVQSYAKMKPANLLLKSSIDLLRLSHLISRGITTGESKGRI